MIYIWHNPSEGNYEIGNEDAYILQDAIHNVSLLYEFTEEEISIAEKILTNLNRAAKNHELELA